MVLCTRQNWKCPLIKICPASKKPLTLKTLRDKVSRRSCDPLSDAFPLTFLLTLTRNLSIRTGVLTTVRQWSLVSLWWRDGTWRGVRSAAHDTAASAGGVRLSMIPRMKVTTASSYFNHHRSTSRHYHHTSHPHIYADLWCNRSKEWPSAIMWPWEDVWGVSSYHRELSKTISCR